MNLEGGLGEHQQRRNATLVVYEKDGDTYKAVGKIDYSYDVNYDKKGKGKVTNVKQTFTDISQK